jgi:hypothetical protein
LAADGEALMQWPARLVIGEAGSTAQCARIAEDAELRASQDPW